MPSVSEMTSVGIENPIHFFSVYADHFHLLVLAGDGMGWRLAFLQSQSKAIVFLPISLSHYNESVSQCCINNFMTNM